MERTLVLIKPDAVQRGLIGNILNRFERKGLKVVGLKLMELSDEILDDHYSHLSDKPFFPRIKSFMRSTPVIAICLEGFEVVGTVRTLCGITNSREAASGSIRGDLGMSIQCNLVHASDSSETAEVEVPRFFAAEELTDYESVTDTVIYASDER
ncbi:MAG: nucleoside-diphosphate kinase [Candidatus Latescibacteria bacterium]|nr:nucleoside-diphosphate kinase [Candidatus Latescibacterota bacterium]MDP7238552.1 nucleoside-diphosphate kinase [Candidatus Latescibacterota bacterium]